ncbi:MAG: redoxin domain-containing protein, partial [Anaerolineales bacterium]
LPLVGGMILLPLTAILFGLRGFIPLAGFAIVGAAAGSSLAVIGSKMLGGQKNGKLRITLKLPIFGRHSYAGHLVHLGIVLMAVGVIGTQAYALEQNLDLSPGTSGDLHEYTLVYKDLRQDSLQDHIDTWASIAVYRGNDYLATLRPQITYYPEYEQAITEPAIRAGLGEDIYLVMFDWSEDGEILLNARINPLSAFIWMGSIVLLLGGLLTWWPSNERVNRKVSKSRRFWSRIAAVSALIFILIVLVSMWGESLTSRRGPGRPLPGEQAPVFSSETVSGEKFSLADYRGEILVINFWATWCPQCEDELQAFDDIWHDWNSKGVQFLGIAMDDSLEAVMNMSDELGIGFPLIVEQQRKISKNYGVSGVPETFIISIDGNIAYYHIGVVDEAILRQEIMGLKGEAIQ